MPRAPRLTAAAPNMSATIPGPDTATSTTDRRRRFAMGRRRLWNRATATEHDHRERRLTNMLAIRRWKRIRHKHDDQRRRRQMSAIKLETEPATSTTIDSGGSEYVGYWLRGERLCDEHDHRWRRRPICRRSSSGSTDTRDEPRRSTAAACSTSAMTGTDARRGDTTPMRSVAANRSSSSGGTATDTVVYSGGLADVKPAASPTRR